METVAIVGVGLIGASFGLALRKSGFQGEIIGVSSPAAIADGLARGAISSSATLADAIRRADLIYLAQPVDRIIQTIPLLAPLLRSGSLVTDAGSTKFQIVATADAHLPQGAFLGGHPVAGKEQRGAAAADPDLFLNRPYVLTPSLIPSPKPFLETLRSIGAQIIEMTPLEHDRTLALTSHLPQLLSTALAATLAQTNEARTTEIFGTGLLDMTRLALSSSELWSSILVTNKDAVNQALDLYIATLRHLQSSLQKCEIDHTFEQARAFATQIRKLPL